MMVTCKFLSVDLSQGAGVQSTHVAKKGAKDVQRISRRWQLRGLRWDAR